MADKMTAVYPATDAGTDKTTVASARPAANEASEVPDVSEGGQQRDIPAEAAPEVQFKIQYGKNSADLKRPASSTVAELKAGEQYCITVQLLLSPQLSQSG